jgi:hypothetical protein
VSKVFIALPTYDNRVDSRQALFLYGARMDNLQTTIKTRGLSALCWCFNWLWADCLNDRTFDYFLMIHADIVPMYPNRWMTKLINEANDAQADLFSVVSPLKNQDGLTSTGLISNEHPKERRLSMTEIMAMPETFNATNVARVFGWEGDTNIRLLVNTGCMLIDLRRNRDKWEKMHFQTHDDVVRVNGKLEATFEPEDWLFSKQAADFGLKVAATRSVKLIHSGHFDYTNEGAWGLKASDT